jgi:hypothetical protein
LAERAQRIAIKDKSRIFNTARVEALELMNLIETAKASIVSAEARRESRGAQARSDYPNRDDVEWMKHTLWYRDGNRLDYKPVNLQPTSVEPIPPKTRTYCWPRRHFHSVIPPNAGIQRLCRTPVGPRVRGDDVPATGSPRARTTCQPLDPRMRGDDAPPLHPAFALTTCHSETTR